jgi:hypothetical protein
MAAKLLSPGMRPGGSCERGEIAGAVAQRLDRVRHPRVRKAYDQNLYAIPISKRCCIIGT